MATYNGWTNWETWNVVVWMENEPATADDFRDASLRGADAAREYVETYVYELEGAPTTGLVGDWVGMALQTIDWHEIAEHYEEDEENED